MKKFKLTFTLLAATSLMSTACAQRDEPLTANNDFACRDNQGNIVDEDRCDGNGDHSGGGMFLFMSSAGYHNKYGKYPKGYNPKAYSGKTRGGFGKSNSVSRGGFGSSARGSSSS